MSQQRIKDKLKLKVKNVTTFPNFVATQNERDGCCCFGTTCGCHRFGMTFVWCLRGVTFICVMAIYMSKVYSINGNKSNQ